MPVYKDEMVGISPLYQLGRTAGQESKAGIFPRARRQSMGTGLPVSAVQKL